MKDKLTKGVFWLGGAKLLVNILALSSTLVLARLLTPDDFGVVAIATSLLAIVGATTELSLAAALIHHKEPTDAHFHTAWTLGVMRAILIGSIFCVSAPFVANFYKDDRLIIVIVVLGISVVLSGLVNPKVVVRTRNLEFWQEFVVTVVQKLSGFAVGVALALAYKSYWALLGGTLASQLAGVVVSYLIYPYRPRFSIRHIRELWSFSIWLTLGQAISTLNWKFDHLLVGAYLGPQALGTYTVGDNLAGMPTRETTGPIQQALFPGFRTVVHDETQLRRTYRRAQALIAAIALPAGFCCSLLAEPLVMLVLGPKWLDSVLVVQVLGCVFALQTMSSTVQPLALAKGETRLLFKRDLLNFCLRVPIIAVGMIVGGLSGIIFARMLSSMIGTVIEMKLVGRLIGLSIGQQLANSIRPLLGVLAMSFGILVTEQFDWVGVDRVGKMPWLLGMVGLGMAIYTITNFALWLVAARPVGPETDLTNMIRKIVARIYANFRGRSLR